MTSCPEALMIWGNFEKKQFVELSSYVQTGELSSCLGRRRLIFGVHRGLVAGAARGSGGGGADGKVVIERLCLSLPHVEKPFNWKVIKSFVPELRSRQVFFRVSGFLCYLYTSYEHSMYISHIRIYAYVTIWVLNTYGYWYIINLGLTIYIYIYI